MAKIDHKKELKHLYNPSTKQCAIVDVPAMNFLMIDGSGDPNRAQAYQEAVEALYAVAYTLKFMVKKGEQAIDYTVMPLEGLWWVPDMAEFSVSQKDKWLWTMLIMQPDFVTADLVDAAMAETAKKNPPALPKLRFESFTEGVAAQIMHIGPYAAEAPTIARLHAFIAEEGNTLRGKHHEIYLGDPRRTAPEKLKTVIRQPMAQRGDPFTDQRCFAIAGIGREQRQLAV
ncbi:MAG TPA: GyrI-like domain-containing protein [Caldilineaceae bacterium]|nr:GyrI-like domain-containing protein [Caldilineaceae bacterium]